MGKTYKNGMKEKDFYKGEVQLFRYYGKGYWTTVTKLGRRSDCVRSRLRRSTKYRHWVGKISRKYIRRVSQYEMIR